MKLKPLVNQLSEFLPFNSNLFTNINTIISLIRSGSLATVTTANAHGLGVGQVIVITGAVEFVPITSLSLNTETNQVTVRTGTIDHGLSLGMNFKTRSTTDLTVTLQDVSDSEYNGEFTLLQVPNRNAFIFQMPFTPANDPPNDGAVLNYAANFFTGLKQVTSVPTTTAFQYTISTSASTNTTDSGSVHSNWRISGAVDLERATDSYTKQAIDKYWLFVTPNASVVSKNRDILNDSVTTYRRNGQVFRQRLIESVNMYVFAPTANDLSGRVAIDDLEDVKVSLFKTILRFPTAAQYDADNQTDNQFVFTYNSSQVVAYNTAFITFQFIFDTNYDITYHDTFNSNQYAPFRNIQGESIINTQDFIWNIDLDSDPDF